MPEEPMCFVIMPFSMRESDHTTYGKGTNHWTNVYRGLIAPAARTAGFHCERDDDDLSSRQIAEGILRKIERAAIVVCDVSASNPNVFLELGWAMRADRPFAIIKDSLTEYTFDLNQQNTLTYDHFLQPVTLEQDVSRLTKFIDATATGPERQFSIASRLGVAVAAIPHESGSDARLHEQLAEILDLARLSRDRAAGFPWPDLLRRGMALLEDASAAVTASRRESWQEIVIATARRHAAVGVSDLQAGMIDQDGTWIVHEVPSVVGSRIRFTANDGGMAAREIMSYDQGAAAWLDSSTNMKRTRSSAFVRQNVALFKNISDGAKVVVEMHRELE